MRPPIPSGMQRDVRQRCKFGCVICSCPIYDYDHVEEYSVVKEHTYENLVLLCPTCHRKKTNGLITKSMIRDALDRLGEKARTSPESIPIMNYSLDVGSNIIEAYSGGCVFQIWDFGHLDIKFDNVPLIEAVLNDINGKNAIIIDRNIYTLSADTWDIEYVGNTLTFRNGLRKVFASIKFDVESKKIIFRGDILLRNGVRVRIKDDGIYANNTLLASNNIISSTGAALTITGAEIKHGHLFTGYCYRNTIVGTTGISGLNALSCVGNIIHKCQFAFVWTNDFLEQLE